MILLIIAAFIIILLCWLLLSPLIINVDTRIPIIEAKWKSIGSVSLVSNKEEWQLKFQILFFIKLQNLNSLITKRASSEKKNENKKREKKPFSFKLIRAILRVMKSFRTRSMLISLDTGDYALNGKLYILYALPAMNKHVAINFENRNYLLLQISNSPLRMLLAYLNIHFFKL